MLLKEIALLEKKNYNWLQRLCITLWGDLLYLDYTTLPRGKGDSDKFKQDALDYMKDRDGDLAEWFAEGASYNGTPTLTKDLYDIVMTNSEERTIKDLVLYKYGNKESSDSKWLSMTISQGSHKEFGEENTYKIKAGTPVIWTQGLADKAEVIIHSKYL